MKFAPLVTIQTAISGDSRLKIFSSWEPISFIFLREPYPQNRYSLCLLKNVRGITISREVLPRDSRLPPFISIFFKPARVLLEIDEVFWTGIKYLAIWSLDSIPVSRFFYGFFFLPLLGERLYDAASVDLSRQRPPSTFASSRRLISYNGEPSRGYSTTCVSLPTSVRVNLKERTGEPSGGSIAVGGRP